MGSTALRMFFHALLTLLFASRSGALGRGEEEPEGVHPDVARAAVGGGREERQQQAVGRAIAQPQQQRRAQHPQRLRPQA